MSRLVEIQRNVVCGQARGALARIQVGYTAVFLLPDALRKAGWFGAQVGIFAPVHDPETGYSCRGFRFSLPGPDYPPGQWTPKWRRFWKAFSFRVPA